MSKIHTSAPPRDSDVKGYVDLKFTTKKREIKTWLMRFIEADIVKLQ